MDTNTPTFTPFPQEIHFDVPDDCMTGFMRIQTTLGLRGYPVIVTPPNYCYYELFARTDGGQIKRTDYWCHPFSPWAFVPYWIFYPEYINAKVLELIVTPLPRGVYPAKVWTPPT